MRAAGRGGIGAVTAALVCVALGATPALASGPPAPAPASSPSRGGSAVAATSPRVGGYVVEGGRRARAVFVVPTVTCTSDDATTIFAVAGFAEPGFLVGAGGVAAMCKAGKASYELADEIFEGELHLSGLAAQPGDAIKAVYRWHPHDGSVSISITNLTRGDGYGLGGADVTGQLGVIEIGASRVTDDGGFLDVPAFDRAAVRGASVDGQSLTGQGVKRTTLVGDDGTALVKSSATFHNDHRFLLSTPR